MGKTYLACALAHQACRKGYSTLYAQTGRLLQELWITRGDGRYLRTLAQIAKTDVLILDDWGLDNPDADQRRITRTSPTPPWPMPFWIGFCTMPIGSNSRARAYGRRKD